MKERTIQTYEEDDISLLDILVTLAQSWKLLVFGSFLIAAFAGVVGLLWPKTFESVAIVRLSEEEVALMHAAPVLDPLIEKFGLLAHSDGVLDDARKELKKHLVFVVDKKTKLATITASASTPAPAQELGVTAIELVLKELQIKGQEKILIEKTILINKRAIASAEGAMESVQRILKRASVSDQSQESAIKNLAVLNADIAKTSQENEELQQKLAPKGLEVYVQEPSLPQRMSSPKLGLVVLLAFMAGGLTLLIFVFIRKAWKFAEQEDRSKQKIALIKKAFKLK